MLNKSTSCPRLSMSVGGLLKDNKQGLTRTHKDMTLFKVMHHQDLAMGYDATCHQLLASGASSDLETGQAARGYRAVSTECITVDKDDQTRLPRSARIIGTGPEEYRRRWFIRWLDAYASYYPKIGKKIFLQNGYVMQRNLTNELKTRSLYTTSD